MYVITAAIVKGGTGKTTTAAAIAQAAAHDGAKVLCIDLDPQGNFSFFMGADTQRAGAFELLEGTPASHVIQTTPQGVDMIPASSDLATIKPKAGSARRLQRALEAIKEKYSLIIVDTPPTMGELQYNALQAADGLIIPLEADISGLQGLYQITDVAKQISRTNPGLQILGTVITRYDPRPKISRFLVETIANKGGEAGAPMLATIRAGVAIREAQAMQQSLYEYAPKSKPAIDYMGLYLKIKDAVRERKTEQ